jgi:glycogen debranching enzyme
VIRDTTLALRSPDPLIDRAVEYAKVNLDESMVCNPDLGCGLVAGYGLSGAASDRPGFGWFFGGDAAINSFAMTAVGQTALVREGVLQFFAKYQRQDGKITHEISQGAGHVDWFSYPYPYYHGDTTPFWILAAGEYWRQTGDTDLIRTLWPNLKRAWEWSRSTDTDGDGLMENPAAGAGALEVGDLQIGILSDVYLSGVWVAALDRFARMAVAMGEQAVADSAAVIRARAVATMEAKLWLPSQKQYAFALLQGGAVNENLTAWPATAMAFDVLDAAKGAEMAIRLAGSAIMTDWGARPLSAASPLFDPLHYNNGAVWPFVTGFVALAQYRYHNAPAGWFALQSIARTGFDHALGRNPELMSGRLYKPLDTAVPQQFFATSMVLTPLVRGLLGLDVDVPARRVRIAPHLPPEWDTVAVDRIPVGKGQLFVAIKRTPGRISASLRASADAGTVDVEFSPALPLGARATGAPAAVQANAGDSHVTVKAAVSGAAELSVSYAGGWSLLPPTIPAIVGRRSQAPRILSERLGADGRYTVALEGLAGRSHSFTVRAPDAGVARALRADVTGGSVLLSPASAAGPERQATITFPREGANADGYTTLTLTVR